MLQISLPCEKDRSEFVTCNMLQLVLSFWQPFCLHFTEILYVCHFHSLFSMHTSFQLTYCGFLFFFSKKKGKWKSVSGYFIWFFKTSHFLNAGDWQREDGGGTVPGHDNLWLKQLTVKSWAMTVSSILYFLLLSCFFFTMLSSYRCVWLKKSFKEDPRSLFLFC